MNPLSLIVPAWARWAILAALLAAFGGFSFYRGAAFEQHRRDAQDAIRDAAAMKTQVAAVTAARTEEHRKTEAVQGVANEIRKQLDVAAAAAPATRAAGERLRDQLAAACPANRASTQPATADGSKTADTARSVLADVQGRLAEAENRTIEFADQSRIAGLGCERIYEALTPPK